MLETWQALHLLFSNHKHKPILNEFIPKNNDLSCPPDAPPDTEIDEHPCTSQG